MISVVLNVYKRPHTLEKQIEAIKNQTINIKSEDIHVWYNYVDGIEQKLPKDKKINTYRCNWNTKFFGRFTIPLMCKNPYIALFDDDVIPGKKWLENCVNTMENNEGILGSAGVTLTGNQYIPNVKYGWNGQRLDKVTRVDLVGHAWFFKQEWGKFMWLEEPTSWDNGEDMFFSYIAKKYNINTYVPPHPPSDPEMWGNNHTLGHKYGSDNNATYRTKKNHYSLRNKIANTLIKKGWQTVKKR